MSDQVRYVAWLNRLVEAELEFTDPIEGLTYDQFIAKVKDARQPVNHPPQQKLADFLRQTPPDPDFDLAQWTKDWQAVEAENAGLCHKPLQTHCNRVKIRNT